MFFFYQLIVSLLLLISPLIIILRISKKDPYRQYLAYYKGWGDYKNYSKDKKAIIYAKSVKDMANKYRKQLTLCKKNLDKNKYIIF